jgi:hypothetical protein
VAAPGAYGPGSGFGLLLLLRFVPSARAGTGGWRPVLRPCGAARGPPRRPWLQRRQPAAAGAGGAGAGGALPPALALALQALAGLLAAAGGALFKFMLVTRAGFNQGFALPHLPVRGVRR